MAKFKRFDLGNKKANYDKFRKDYSERNNDYVKRKAEYDEQQYHSDEDDRKSKNFQPQRNGVRL